MSPTDDSPAPSLLLYFDASVHYGPDNASPVSAAVGYHVDDGTETVVEGSERVAAVVSSAHLEFRALLAAVRAVEELGTRVASLHVHGDADAVIRTVDPAESATPSDRVTRRRVERIREGVADVPVVTYRAVGRGENERAHALARAAHR